MLDNTLRNKFVTALLNVPVTETFGGRSSLLDGLPPIDLNRNEGSRRLDLERIVSQLDQLGRIRSTGVRPLVVVAENALRYVEGTDAGDALVEVMRDLRAAYGGETAAPSAPPPEPEALVFGRDERLPYVFVANAIHTARSVARLRVPRYINGQPDKEVYGTGWLIAPGVLITNHHVVDARERDREPPARPGDFQQQAHGLAAWFDYQRESGPHHEVQGADLLACDPDLDYAVLRLTQADKVADRPPLPLYARQPVLAQGKRLNIVQHSGGGAVSYAIRNNFYVGLGTSAAFLRYLTDTEPGSSGSPVLDDSWQVLALHHAATRVTPKKLAALPHEPSTTTPDEEIRYHNEGVAIHSILASLPDALRNEIARAQGWI